jgi:hypothetical protein
VTTRVGGWLGALMGPDGTVVGGDRVVGVLAVGVAGVPTVGVVAGDVGAVLGGVAGDVVGDVVGVEPPTEAAG